jgi:tetratricopeptide (TPR) repeat protein
MRPHPRVRWAHYLATLLALTAPGCQSKPDPVAETAVPPVAAAAQAPPPPATLKDEIPPSELNFVMAEHFKGLGHMERYEYREAADAFRNIRERAPGWIPASINLAIALLNDSGVKVEKAKNEGGEAAGDNFDDALKLLADVLARQPDNRHAHFCTGVIFEQQGKLDEAHKHFARVTELDPSDPVAWYWSGSTVTDATDPSRPAGPKEAPAQIALFKKALERDPYLTPALYKMAMALRFTPARQEMKESLARWQTFDPDRPQPSPGPGNTVVKSYGEMGRYASIVNPVGANPEKGYDEPYVAPRFDPARPIEIALPAGDRWAKPADFSGTQAVLARARSRFGAAVAAFDADNDGRLDLFLAAAVAGPKGVRDALLLNKADGRFEDASARFGLPSDRASLGVAAADFDADRNIDLFLTGVGENRLLRNKDGKTFEDVTAVLKQGPTRSIALTARWLDLDQDGDLDLYVVNHAPADQAEKCFLSTGPIPTGALNQAFRNDGQPEAIPGVPAPAQAPVAVASANAKATRGLSLAFTPWPGGPAIGAGAKPHTGVAALDVDNDRDLDLVITADGSPPVAILNDRLGEFHEAALAGWTASDPVSGILSADLDADGRTDLVTSSVHDKVHAWRNVTSKTTAADTKISFEPLPTNASNWSTVLAIDLDLDGRTDLLGTPEKPSKTDEIVVPRWARNEGQRLALQTLPVGRENGPINALATFDLIGDPLSDLLILAPGQAPALARNAGNGHHWISLQLGGHWKVKPELMRTNSHGIGTRILIEGQGVHVAYDYTTNASGLGQSITPIVLGMGTHERADLVHIRWPDGVMQCELNVTSNELINLAENNRKTGSCPVLFTWNGERYECLGDFLGGGGLGYLVAPGVYGQPDRDESVAISDRQLRPTDGVYKISIVEPMDEVAYLERVFLDVVDQPPGVSSTPDERFAPEGDRPTGELIGWKETIRPVRASDLRGNDLMATLEHWDGKTADAFRKLEPWIGYAEEHGILLDFGDRLANFTASDPIVLCLAGWVEYPYSQTNYAAATAGVTLTPPTIERQLPDGTWKIIEPHAGYPAGLSRMTTLDLTGKLLGESCVLRIQTNMECYYDQAFLVRRDHTAEKSLRVTSLKPTKATLGYRGYMREVSADGRPPLLYAYDYVDPAPLARLTGKLTRYGDVLDLLTTDDDLLCLVGPGDEAKVEFSAGSLPALAPGWTRRFVLRSVGYCKDADPFTAGSDTVEPLPWRAMPPFPFKPGTERPHKAAFDAYLRDYHTRPAGGDR